MLDLHGGGPFGERTLQDAGCIGFYERSRLLNLLKGDSPADRYLSADGCFYLIGNPTPTGVQVQQFGSEQRRRPRPGEPIRLWWCRWFAGGL